VWSNGHLLPEFCRKLTNILSKGYASCKTRMNMEKARMSLSRFCRRNKELIIKKRVLEWASYMAIRITGSSWHTAESKQLLEQNRIRSLWIFMKPLSSCMHAFTGRSFRKFGLLSNVAVDADEVKTEILFRIYSYNQLARNSIALSNRSLPRGTIFVLNKRIVHALLILPAHDRTFCILDM
jgi:hypothetical protein